MCGVSWVGCRVCINEERMYIRVKGASRSQMKRGEEFDEERR